ncbi:4-hydroxybenzoate 3-monooxygenase [Streptomyces caatingaensis]|uniref:4-hydroxybenzoate 3-monooxygenase n=1 Tax=Streptomyces caatingaensis TaxID=1678637 RepID=A0A0K9XIX4_9ACTN|nr:4-hydroxybenzoate 3-monooxygenase [Streptomyces caatingaensis]KNB53344.1 4-hydroxybenzoate 3-monooxygenase [Streptomyces caatingaensis]
MRTTVGIVGAGPAGLLLARLLHRAGVDCVVLEALSRAELEGRPRGGVFLEQGAVDALRACGAAGRLDVDGVLHEGFELRFGGRAHRFDVAGRTGGRAPTLYPRHELVKDLIALQLADGAPLLFDARVTALEGLDGERPLVRYSRAGEEHVLECSYVAGCDGADGVARRALLVSGAARLHRRGYPYAWLGVSAGAPPTGDELLLAAHDRGFALQGVRFPEGSRLCLQVPAGTGPDDWSDARVREELEVRLAVAGRPLNPGPLSDRCVVPLRGEVVEPMRHGRLLLAGDAAHVVPPTAAKGTGLALADAVTMARAFAHLRRSGSTALLDRYSEHCLRRVWQAQHFAHTMTTLLHAAPGADAYERRLRASRLDRLVGPTAAAAEFAENYAGLPGDAPFV